MIADMHAVHVSGTHSKPDAIAIVKDIIRVKPLDTSRPRPYQAGCFLRILPVDPADGVRQVAYDENTFLVSTYSSRS